MTADEMFRSNVNISENILALYESGKLAEPTYEAGKKYCCRCSCGSNGCSVKTRLGWSCDICLESELLYLWSKGVHTVNSCCGHGNPNLKGILVAGPESEKKMGELGYEKCDPFRYKCGMTNWKPKSMLIRDDVNEGTISKLLEEMEAAHGKDL